MSAAMHRIPAVLACLGVAALMSATLASGHPLDATDLDHDGYKNWGDNCPNNYNPKQADHDGDTAEPLVNEPAPHPSVGPLIVYPYTPAAPEQLPAPLPTDMPADQGGDACDVDDDGDGVTDNPKRDNCKLTPNPDQRDTDFDGAGDACDPTPNGPAAGAAGAVDPNDRTPPDVAVALPRAMRLEAVGRRLAVAVRCSEGCSLDGRLVVGKRIVARGSAQLERRARTFVFLDFSSRALRALRRKRSAVATFRLAAKDVNGNRAVAQKRIRLRR